MSFEFLFMKARELLNRPRYSGLIILRFGQSEFSVAGNALACAGLAIIHDSLAAAIQLGV
jgi:hypothetical protein